MRWIELEGHRFPVDQIARYYDSAEQDILIVFFKTGGFQRFPNSFASDLDKRLNLWQPIIEERLDRLEEETDNLDRLEQIRKDNHDAFVEELKHWSSDEPPQPPIVPLILVQTRLEYDYEEPAWYSWTRIKSMLSRR